MYRVTLPQSLKIYHLIHPSDSLALCFKSYNHMIADKYKAQCIGDLFINVYNFIKPEN